MADNTWGQRPSEDSDPNPASSTETTADLPASGQDSMPAATFGTQRTETTAQMPSRFQPQPQQMASPAASPGSAAAPSHGQPPIPPAQRAIGAAPATAPASASQVAAEATGSGPAATQPPSVPPSVSSTGWSPLGATPSSPPVRSGAENGLARYLPPVAPPDSAPTSPAVATSSAEALQAEEKVKRSGSRWGWRALVSFVAGGLIAAAGFGAAQLSPASETTEASEAAVVESSVTTTTAAPRPATTQRDSGTVPLVPLDVDEPASFVAETLGPAVVQIDTDLGVGSGVIYGDGLILTNNHVIQGSTQVRVQLADGSVLSGEVLGTDVKTDVGVVSVGPGLELPRAQLALGEKAKVGQIAIAIGSPFDLQQSVTAGIVSAVDRPIPNTERGVVAMIQTDAPINPGNSGGALADRQGRVIGINTSIQTDGVTNANVGVGFAIPIDTAIRVADLLVAGEPIEPGFLGVRGDEPPGGEAGVVLVDVTEGSAAEGAGLVVGDRVLSLNGAPVTGFAELAGLVVANQAGDTVTLEIVRDDEVLEIDVVLGINDN